MGHFRSAINPRNASAQRRQFLRTQQRESRAAMTPAEAAPKKKHVRFARMEEDIDRDEQEEDTLFDKRKDNKEGLKSALKGGKGVLNPGSDQVDVIRPGRSQSNTGTCWRWLVSLVLCASFLGLVGLYVAYEK